MSSTDEKQLAAFFEERLVTAAQRLRARDVKFFPMGPADPRPALQPPADGAEQDSWYVAPPAQPQVFTREGDHLADALQSMWEQQDLPELAELASPLKALAKQLEQQEQRADDISPFVYVLY